MRYLICLMLFLSVQGCTPNVKTEIIGGESKANSALFEETPRKLYIDSSPKQEEQYIIIIGE